MDDTVTGKGDDNDIGVYDVWNEVLFVGRASMNVVNDVVTNLNDETSSIGEPHVNVGKVHEHDGAGHQEMDVHSLTVGENENALVGNLIGLDECADVNDEEVEAIDKGGQEVQNIPVGDGEKAMVVYAGDTGAHPDVPNEADDSDVAVLEETMQIVNAHDDRKDDAIDV